MSTYRTPGVYIEEISKFPPSVAAVETAIPAFIGYTQKAQVGPINYFDSAEGSSRMDPDNASIVLNPVPIRITSLLEYEELFGRALEEGASITVTIDDTTVDDVLIDRKIRAEITEALAATNPRSPHNMYYAIQAFYANGGGPCYIVPIGPMSATTAAFIDTPFERGVKAVEKVDEVTLFVIPEAIHLSNYNGNTWLTALNQCVDLQDRFAIMDVQYQTGTSITAAASTFRGYSLPLPGLKYAAAYYPYVETTLDYLFNEMEVTIAHNVNADGVPGPGDGDADGANLNTLNAGEANEDLILYNLAKGAIADMPLVLPPSPLIAGQYATTDELRGVWKAPANVSLGTVSRPVIKIGNPDQDGLNIDTSGKSINAIRGFTGKGTLIWGARTLAGNSNEWRYVPVRRFFNFAEESIKKASEQFVFEPNDANTWTNVQSMIENFLTLQWRAGALQGAKPEQAFFVRVGLGLTMTALDILEGRMNVEIGMAVVRPAEFIILKFSHKMAEA